MLPASYGTSDRRVWKRVSDSLHCAHNPGRGVARRRGDALEKQLLLVSALSNP